MLMGKDSFTEVTTQSWGGRLGQSVKGVVVGGMLLIAAFPLQFWNEGRAVDRAKAIEEGAGAVISVASDAVVPANEGKLVHMIGQATTEEVLADTDFPVSAKAIKLSRVVEMFQWKEESHSETREKLGGGTETTTTYTYAKAWSPKLIDGSTFRKPEGHGNPASMPYAGKDYQANDVRLGAFRLNQSLIGRLDRFEPLGVNVENSKVPHYMADKMVTLQGDTFYLGMDPGTPEIGDVRVSFKAVMPAAVSIVSQQRGDSFVPYMAKTGEVELLSYGETSAAAMFKGAQESNATLTWILRGVGFFLMLIGLKTILAPLHTLGAVVPVIGYIVEFGTGLLAFVLALALSLITIAIAWIFYRPLLGIGLLVVGVGSLVLLKFLRRGGSVSAASAEGGTSAG
jgi:hypothetical protein